MYSTNRSIAALNNLVSTTFIINTQCLYQTLNSLQIAALENNNDDDDDEGEGKEEELHIGSGDATTPIDPSADDKMV